MPDDHCPSISQVTTVDDQFGTHSVVDQCWCLLAIEVRAKPTMIRPLPANDAQDAHKVNHRMLTGCSSIRCVILNDAQRLPMNMKCSCRQPCRESRSWIRSG
jgi:hypothetical protein